MSVYEELYVKLKKEYDEFIESIKSLPITEVIDKAYEIAYKKNILSSFDWIGEYDDEACKALLVGSPQIENMLDYLYRSWIEDDHSDWGDLVNCIKCCAKQISGGVNDDKYKS